MFLSDVFEQLNYGELRNLHIGGANDSGIQVDNYPDIISHINLGLTSLHKRFPLRLEEAIIQQYRHISTYHLRSEFAKTSDSTQPVKYIMDTPLMPFNPNILKIEQVFSEFGEERPINDSNSTWSVYVPAYDTVVIPFNDMDNAFSVVYRANHDRISATGINPSTVELTIPDSLLEPLLMFVTNRVVSSMGGLENQNEASVYLQKYELACNEINSLGLLNRDLNSNTKLEMNGWL